MRVEPGSAVPVAAVLTVPVGQSAGDHRIGVEVVGEDGSVALGQVTLSLASAAPVALSISPATVSARAALGRGAKFRVHLTNRGDETLDLDLSGAGEGVEVQITPNRVVLQLTPEYQLDFDSRKMWTHRPDAAPPGRL